MAAPSRNDATYDQAAINPIWRTRHGFSNFAERKLIFRKQEPREKHRLLEFVVSNSTWKVGELQAVLRQPFDIISEMSAMAALWIREE